MNTIKRNSNSLIYLVIFFIFFFVVIISALLYKTVRIVQDSRFTGDVFNVVIVGSKVYAIHVDRSNKSMSYIAVKNLDPHSIKRDPLAYSILLGVPIQALIYDTHQSDLSPFDQNFFKFSHLMDIAGDPRFQKTGLNTDDLLKIYLTQKNTSPENKSTQSFSINDFHPSQYAKTDASLFELFKESDIINKQVSIQIINATEVNGLGARVSRIFENWGYDVVSVISGSQTSSQIILHTQSDIEDAQNIQQILNFPVHQDSSPSIADISIVIADNTAHNLLLNSSLFQ